MKLNIAPMISAGVGILLGASVMLIAPPTTTASAPGGEPSVVSVETVAHKGKDRRYVKRPRVGRAVTHSGRRLDFNARKDGCILVPYGDIMPGLPMDDGEWYCPR